LYALLKAHEKYVSTIFEQAQRLHARHIA